MITPEFLSSIADEVQKTYAALQESIIKDMARRFTKLETSPTNLWQMEIYEESGGLFDYAARRIGEASSRSRDTVAKAFLEAGYQASGTGALSPSARQVLNAGLRKTLSSIHNLTGTTAFAVQQSYIRHANLAYLQVASGAMSYQQAIRNAVLDAAEDGIEVQYPSGHKDMIDVAIRRAVLTGVNQTAAQVSLSNAEKLGTCLFETTAHGGARPEHTVWQGQVFYTGEPIEGFEEFYESTQYGEVTGLCGINCRHSFHPFVLGVSERKYTDEQLRDMAERTVEYRGEQMPVYKAAQIQRRLERDLRALKRQETAAKERGDASALRSIRQKLQAKSATMRGFISQTGLPRQRDREGAVWRSVQ
jgi:hypothetical protein